MDAGRKDMNDILAGLFGFTLGKSIGGHQTNHTCHTDTFRLEQLQREANELKKKELNLTEEENYLLKVKMFLDSVDINCNQDDLEIPTYDELEELSYNRKFYDACEIQDKLTPFDGRWSQEKHVGFYNYLKAKTTKTRDEEMMISAFEKFTFGIKKHFGTYLGKSVDRYDYIMYLKCGPSYQAKYITQESLLEILGNNKYGYSKHLMGL